MRYEWDDLMRDLPLEPMAGDLSARVSLRLQAQRSRERRQQILVDGAMAGLAVLGLAALAPAWPGAESSLRLGTLESSSAWVGRLGLSPAPAVWGAVSGGLAWARHLATNVGVQGLFGMILLALPLFFWLSRLMPERARASEDESKIVSRQAEGVTA